MSESHLSIRVSAHGTEGELPVEGFLIGNGAGKYTGLVMDNGTVVAVIKSTVRIVMTDEILAQAKKILDKNQAPAILPP